MSTTNENLALWDEFSPCPDNAKKKIEGGKLKGKSDISPIWRLKMLTSHFGPCGFGWYTEIVDKWIDEAEVDYNPSAQHGTKESVAWVTINLYVKDRETNEWSKPIVGVGGSKFNGKGQGDGANDEAFKMAETDAMSVACKKLGMAAEVYWEAEKTKYTAAPEKKTTEKKEKETPAAESAEKKEKPKTKPLIEKGNALWPKAIAYCVTKNVEAKTLKSSYTITDETIAELQKAIDAQKKL